MANITVSPVVDEILKKDTKEEIKKALELEGFHNVHEDGTASINAVRASFGDLSGSGGTAFGYDTNLDYSSVYGALFNVYSTEIDAPNLTYVDGNSILNAGLCDSRYQAIEYQSPVTVITGAGGETHSRYKTGWTTNDIEGIDTAFGSSVIETVKFGSEVDSIANVDPNDDEIFKFRTGLKYVDFGLIQELPNDTCRVCTDLERVTMRTTKKIGQAAFFDCEALTFVDLGSVENIRYNAFKNCTALESITIPASVTVLGNNVFDGCSSLSEVNCYANESVFDPYGGNVFQGTASSLVIHAKPNTGWTAGTDLSIQGNDSVTVILDLV